MARRIGLRERLNQGGVIQVGRAVDRPGDLVLATSLTTVGYVAVDENTSMRDVHRAIRAIESTGMHVVGMIFGSSTRATTSQHVGSGVLEAPPSVPQDQLL